MKKQLFIGLMLLAILPAGRAALYYQGPTDVGANYLGTVQHPTIVDGNPASVIANSMTLSGLDSSLSSITVTLSVSGGMNNGLYAYLVGPGATTVTLLNQPGVGVDGFGALGSGMNITLQNSGAVNGSIQNTTSGSPLSGAYNAAGNLSDFNTLNPNATWTLYFADTIAGGGNATLNGWSLDITAVPEPVNVAMIIFGAGVVLWGCFRNYRHRTRRSSLVG